MRAKEFLGEVFANSLGAKSLFTDPGDPDWQNEKDFFKKWFSRPFLTNGPAKNNSKKDKKKR